MAKDFNKDADQSDAERQRQRAQQEGRTPRKAPDADPETARKRAGEGFEDAGDEYAESGSKGAGYRETRGNKA